jgi:hypothetical protein
VIHQHLRRQSTASMNAAPPAAPTGATLVVDPFCYRQFKDPNYAGTKINVDKAEFEKIVNEFFEKSGQTLADGYAPFCKHVFMPNFTDATSPVVEITADIEPLIRTAYEARTKDEVCFPCIFHVIMHLNKVSCQLILAIPSVILFVTACRANKVKTETCLL